jgi:hypothetical protein
MADTRQPYPTTNSRRYVPMNRRTPLPPCGCGQSAENHAPPSVRSSRHHARKIAISAELNVNPTLCTAAQSR